MRQFCGLQCSNLLGFVHLMAGKACKKAYTCEEIAQVRNHLQHDDTHAHLAATNIPLSTSASCVRLDEARKKGTSKA
eukprot:4986239-Amphidinium_carterae.1